MSPCAVSAMTVASFAMPSASLDVGTARLMPRPANRSLTLPIEITPISRLDSASSSVGPVGSSA